MDQTDSMEFLRQQIEELSGRLEDKIAELSLIKEIGGIFARIDDFQETCRIILDVVIRNTLAQNFSIMLVDRERQRLFLVAASDPENKRFIADTGDILHRENLRYSFRHGEGIAGRVLAEARAILVADTAKSTFFASETAGMVKVRSLLSVPMFHQGETVTGVLNISHTKPNIFKRHELYLFSILADLIALLLESSLALQRLKASEEKYRALTENSNDGIAIIAAGGHTYSNPRYRRLTGYSEEELHRLGFDHLFSTNGPEQEMFHGLSTLAAEHGQLQKGIIRTRDGKQMEVEASMAPLPHLGPDALIVSIRDLSYRRHLERQLRQFQKMEAIGTLAGGVAHDFNNILSAIMGYTELSIRRLPPSTPVKNYLAQIQNASNRAKNLIKQILTFSRQGEQERAVVSVDIIVKEAVKLLRSTLASNIDIRQHIAAGSLVLTDPVLVQQIVMNLAINAAQAMAPAGGTLDIRLEKVDVDDRQAAAAGLPRGAFVLLTVTDTGQGMDAAVMERIFEPYFTTKAQGVGTGMGLAVVHGIVKALKGHIAVESQPGCGSTFRIYLPRVLDGATPEAAVVQPVSGRGEKILLIDDERTLTEMGKELLTGLHYEVVTATSGEEALKVLAGAEDGIDLVITDQGMADMDGIALAERLLALHPNLPVIMCSGYYDALDEQRALALGIRKVVMKPVDFRELAAILRRILESGDNTRGDG
ncbi:MAG: ATP-binding protein [Thermodesulfobacteriota bacterium]